MTIHYRTGRQSDVVACVKLLSDWVDETPWGPDLLDHDELIEGWREFFKTELVWVAEDKNQIVGFCTRGEDNIGALYVAKEQRSTGIGKRLLDLAKENRDWITVWAYEKNVDALRFYAREGLVEICREVEKDSNLMNIEHRWIKPG